MKNLSKKLFKNKLDQIKFIKPIFFQKTTKYMCSFNIYKQSKLSNLSKNLSPKMFFSHKIVANDDKIKNNEQTMVALDDKIKNRPTTQSSQTNSHMENITSWCIVAGAIIATVLIVYYEPLNNIVFNLDGSTFVLIGGLLWFAIWPIIIMAMVVSLFNIFPK